jgi:hypothetical protein
VVVLKVSQFIKDQWGVNWFMLGVLAVVLASAISNCAQAEGLSYPTYHWRLVYEEEIVNPFAGTRLMIQRTPINAVRYQTANACARVGAAMPGPVTDSNPNIVHLIACIPYKQGDKDTFTPL